MNFLARVIRYLFWVLVVSWVVRLLGRIVGGMLRQASGVDAQDVAGASNTSRAPSGTTDDGTATANRKLVRDPVCGMHIAEVLAVPLREGGELVHFCSTACRDAYLNGTRKIAANG